MIEDNIASMTEIAPRAAANRRDTNAAETSRCANRARDNALRSRERLAARRLRIQPRRRNRMRMRLLIGMSVLVACGGGDYAGAGDDGFPAADAGTVGCLTSNECPAGYDDASLDAFAQRAKGWRKAGDAYIFMINGAKARAPAAALALQERLR
jgi:hypothetical protein